MDRLVFVGGVERNLSDKIDEVHDSLFLESRFLKAKYKEIHSGIVIDSKKFDHVLERICDIFGVNGHEELAILLDGLNRNNIPSIYCRFIYDKFGLSTHLSESVIGYLTKMSIPIPQNTYDCLSIVVEKNPELKPEFDALIKSTHESRFPLEMSLPEYEPIGDQQSGSVKLKKIMAAIDRLGLMHQAMSPIIKKNFNSMSKLASRIASLV